MTVKLEDFKTFHRRPCVRDALLTGIVVGFSLGGVRASMGGESSLLFTSIFTRVYL